MTLKYESEILFDLMKRDGDDTPSDVLPYESELKEKYLKQVEGAYPKLQDYRPEWLNYNLFAHIPADFPVETLSNVTEATVDNVVPYAYRSAILKGQTLVNLSNNLNNRTMTIKDYYHDEVVCDLSLLSENKTYSVLFYVSDVSGKHDNYNYIDLGVGQASIKTSFDTTNGELMTRIMNKNGWSMIVFNYSTQRQQAAISGGCDKLVTRPLRRTTAPVDGESITFTRSGYIVLEGDWSTKINDLPFTEFFEGMQSVKMPVLTTTGKNLLDTTSMWINGYASNSSVLTQSNSTKSLIVNVKPNTTYTFTRTQLTNRLVISSFKGNHEDLPITKELFNDGMFNQNTVQFTTPDDAEYVIIYVHNESTTPNGWVKHGIYQLEEGSVVTSYEPFKSNILTVNEPVELRGIGEVQDTLDCLTGEVTERIGEIVLDGSENISEQTVDAINHTRIKFKLPQPMKSNGKSICSHTRIRMLEPHGEWEYCLISNDTAYLQLSNSKLETPNVDGVRKYMAQQYQIGTPITIHYQLAEKVIKTVDITVKDHDGNTLSRIKPIEGTMHLSTSGTPIKPSFNGEIPVEATNQNLASFIEE